MKRIGLLLSCLVLGTLLWATNPTESYQGEAIEQRNFDEAEWQKIISDIDYSKDLKAEEKEEKLEKTDEEASNWRNPIQFNDEFGRKLSIGLLAILGIVLLVLVLRFLLVAPQNRRLSKEDKDLEITVEELAENLEAHDPSSLIEQAITAENYRLAVRLYYLKTIRELSLKGEIQWKPDKTNSSYLEEMEKHDLYQKFQNMTRIFERVWYGNRSLNATDFEQIRPEAMDLLTQIESLPAEKEKL